MNKIEIYCYFVRKVGGNIEFGERVLEMKPRDKTYLVYPGQDTYCIGYGRTVKKQDEGVIKGTLFGAYVYFTKPNREAAKKGFIEHYDTLARKLLSEVDGYLAIIDGLKGVGAKDEGDKEDQTGKGSM